MYVIYIYIYIYIYRERERGRRKVRCSLGGRAPQEALPGGSAPYY